MYKVRILSLFQNAREKNTTLNGVGVGFVGELTWLAGIFLVKMDGI